MGKDREGIYHPRKGKPSGVGKAKASELNVDVAHLTENFSIADKYITDEEDISPNVRVMHPNRNVDKGEESQKTKKQNVTDSQSNTIEHEVPIDTVVAEELYGILSKEVFAALANYTSNCCVSIFVPMQNGGLAIDQNNKHTFKSLLQQCSDLLSQKGIEPDLINKILEPGYTLLLDEQFWNKSVNGLAFFISNGYFKYVKMPAAPQEKIFINTSFYVSPIIPMLTSREHFFLLVISKKHAKLFRGDAFGMEYISIPEMPNGIEDVVHLEEKDDQKLFRTGSSGDGSGANFHGIGSGKPDEKTTVAMYLEEVDDTIWKEVLHSENAPLVLAGVEYLIPIYKQVSSYNNIWDDAITGNHEYDDTESLYQKAIEKLAPYFTERSAKALARYANQSATDLTSSNPEEIIPAAHYARISHLFVQRNEHIWGQFDEQNNKLISHNKQLPEDECLIDKAVTKTLLNGGEVYFLDKEQMPSEIKKMCAIMRYEVK